MSIYLAGGPIPYTLDVSKHVLVCWNTNSSDSADLKDYYLATRPHFSSVQTLGLACTVGESMTSANYVSQIRTPVLSYLESHPDVLYIVLMYDVPTRTSDGDTHSVAYRLHRAKAEAEVTTGGLTYQDATERFAPGKYQAVTALVTHVTAGTVADVEAYIDKLATFGTTYNPSGVEISPSSGGYAAAEYVIDNERHADYSGETIGADLQSGLSSEGVSASDVTYSTTHITSAANVTGYFTWGYNRNKSDGNYANDGSVTLTGASNWYACQTIESFNGRRSTSQENFVGQFSADAYGGTSYSRTPACMVCHVEEPSVPGVNDNYFFRLWARGWNFAECAWQSRRTPYFMPVGDPLVKR